MSLDIDIQKVSNYYDLLDVVPLKAMDDSECCNSYVSEEMALDKVLHIIDDGNIFWIARVDSQPVGYAVGQGKRNSFESNGVYVTPEFRREGIATKLKQTQIEFARSEGFEKIYTGVSCENVPSRKLQESMGFDFEEKYEKYVLNLK